MIYPSLLQKLIDFYKKMPGVGDKSAERMALATLDLPENEIKEFAKNIVDSKIKLKNCQICGNLTEMIYVIFVVILIVIRI